MAINSEIEPAVMSFAASEPVVVRVSEQLEARYDYIEARRKLIVKTIRALRGECELSKEEGDELERMLEVMG